MENIKEKEKGALADKNKRLIIIFTAIFLGVILLFGIIAGTIALVRSSGSYLSYRGSVIGEGVSNYLTMMAKYDYMRALLAAGVAASDTAVFWRSETDDGSTYGEVLRAECDAYLKRVLVGAYYFDNNAKLTNDDKKIIEDAVSGIVSNFADRREFDAVAKEYGFTLRDVKKGAELIYKYTLALNVIFGYEGESLKNGAFDDLLDEFYSGYTYVKLLFIRTSDKYVKDNDTGKIDLVELDEVERELVQDKIERIRYLMSGEGNEIISEETLDYYINEYSADEMNRSSGYYLSTTSSHTLKLNEAYPEVVEAALSAKEGKYYEIETDYGVCFMYRGDLPIRGYVYPSNEAFFGDFYSQAAAYIYLKELTKYSKDVKASDDYLGIDPVNVPYDYKLAIRF